MPKKQETPIRAEVLLRRADARDARKVASFLEAGGARVSSVGSTSISIRCDRTTFEQLFSVRLTRMAVPKAGHGSVKDFGRQEASPYQTEDEIRVPDAISGEVEGVYIQRGPLKFV